MFGIEARIPPAKLKRIMVQELKSGEWSSIVRESEKDHKI